MADQTRVGIVTQIISAKELKVQIGSDAVAVTIRQQQHVGASLGDVVTVRVVDGRLMFVDGRF